MSSAYFSEPPVDADAVFRNFLRECLARAADQFGVVVVGQPVFGWRLRTIGSRAQRKGAPDVWLRVVSQELEWERGNWWSGAVEAGDITNIHKPIVIGVFEWVEESWRIQRAEAMTLLSGRPCSSRSVATTEFDLPEKWWTDLRRSVDQLAQTSTPRRYADREKVIARIGGRFGAGVDITRMEWETVHGDFHWSNLMAPHLGLLDWELWGTGPAGTDAASLLCHSLLVPTLAEQVATVFADKLNGEPGRLAQLYVIAHMLRRVDGGDYPELGDPLYHRADELLRARHPRSPA